MGLALHGLRFGGFLHQACRGLPIVRKASAGDSGAEAGLTIDRFYTQVVEHAVAYFGSRVLYPSRPAPDTPDSITLSRAACERAAQAAVASGREKFDCAARNWGYYLGNQIYAGYLEGKAKPRALRRLFLTHLDKPGAARKVCTAVIARIRAALHSRS